MAIHDLLCVCVSIQDLQKSLSSQGSPSITPAPFGSHMTTSSGADANSPALSQNSAPSSTPNDHSFHPSLRSDSLARQLARPAELDRVSSGYLEPGELLFLKTLLPQKVLPQKVLPCSTASPPCLLLLSSFCVSSTGNILLVALARIFASWLLTASKHLSIQALPELCPLIGSHLGNLLLGSLVKKQQTRSHVQLTCVTFT